MHDAQEDGVDHGDSIDGMRLVEDLIPVYDALGLAGQHLSGGRSMPFGPDAAEGPSFAAGMEMIMEMFAAAFARQGVEIIDPKPGDPFDPGVHESTEARLTLLEERDTVLRVHRHGFRAEGRLIRPASVSVLVKPKTEGERKRAAENDGNERNRQRILAMMRAARRR